MLSSLAASMKEHVLTMITSASFGSGVNAMPGLVQMARHDFGIDEILGTAKRHEADLDGRGRAGRRPKGRACSLK